MVGALRVDPVADSRVVLIKVRDGILPELRIADAVAKAYADQNVDRKVSAAEDAVAWLDNQATSLKRDLSVENELLALPVFWTPP